MRALIHTKMEGQLPSTLVLLFGTSIHPLNVCVNVCVLLQCQWAAGGAIAINGDCMAVHGTCVCECGCGAFMSVLCGVWFVIQSACLPAPWLCGWMDGRRVDDLITHTHKQLGSRCTIPYHTTHHTTRQDTRIG